MIVVAEDKDVREKFPIPLINRLEKHFLGWDTLLIPDQRKIVEDLQTWTTQFAEVKFQLYEKGQKFIPQDVFIGFHHDALASIVLRVSRHLKSPDEISEKAKQILLNVAAPDAMARLSETALELNECERLCQTYYESHFSTLADAIKNALENPADNLDIPMLLVTTQSRLLTKDGQDSLVNDLGIPVKILPLQQMNTEKQFCEKVQDFLKTDGAKVLLVQAQLLNKMERNLIDCARYVIQNETHKFKCDDKRCCIAIVLQVIKTNLRYE